MEPATVAARSVDRARLKALMHREEERFRKEHPRSQELFQRARHSLLSGVPMNWMTKWASPFPVFVKEARGARFTDVDGREYVDLCLGDTGAMTGHSPEAAVKAIRDGAQVHRSRVRTCLTCEGDVIL